MSSVPANSPPPPPLQVYHCSHHPQDDSLLVPDPLSLPAPIVEPDIPIALHKGMHSTLNPYYNVLSYHRLCQSFYICLSSISSVSIPKSVGDALAHPGWRQAMLDEMSALQNNGT